MSKSLAETFGDETREKFERVCTTLKFEVECEFAVQILQNNNYLRNAAAENMASLNAALISVATLGLSLNPAEKLAYLATRNTKVGDTWQTRIILDPSYMGLCKLATDSGIEWIQARMVYASDIFVDRGMGEKPSHECDPFSPDRGEFRGVYCVAKLGNGDYLTETMAAADVLSIRDRSEAWKRNESGPWKTDFGEMAKKSVVRRAFKMWPKKDARMVEAVDLSNQAEGFEPIEIEHSTYSAGQLQTFHVLIQSDDATGLLGFQQSMPLDVFTSLYGSFPKGTKVANKAIVDGLLARGYETFRKGIESIQEDPTAMPEVVDELSTEEFNVFVEMAEGETQREILAYRSENDATD